MDLRTPWESAQQSVIGCMLIDERTVGEIMQSARPELFGDASLRHLFEAAQGLWLENRPLDPVTLQDAAGAGYNAEIANCIRNTPSVHNLAEYLRILRSEARLAAMRAGAFAIVEARTEEEAAAAYDTLSGTMQGTEDIEDLSWGELVSEYLDRMSDKTPVRYLTWGIEQLDQIIQVSRGKFVVLGADSSVGKTALALQFAYHMASTGLRVGFFSLETDKESLTDRLMAEKQVAGINLPRTKKKALSLEDKRRAAEAGVRSDKISLRIIRKAETVEQIRARTLQRRFDVIFVDYMQLIAEPGRERWEIVTQISMKLHRMAQQLGVVVIGLSQLTPPDKSSKRAPSKDDLRESRQLKHDADVILLMSLGGDGEREWRELQIAKNKDGRLGQMRLLFDAEHMSFSYMAPPSKNPYAEDGKHIKRLQRAHPPEEQGSMFTELGPEEGGEIPF